jgi:hypothetical protein
MMRAQTGVDRSFNRAAGELFATPAMINAALTSGAAVFLVFSWSAIDPLQRYMCSIAVSQYRSIAVSQYRSMLKSLPPDPLIHMR